MSEKDLQKEIMDLKAQIKKLQKNNLGLVFEDKLEDVVTDCQQNIPVLKEVKAKRIISDEQNPNNLLIEGDNYHSLSVLNYTHKKNIDLIYIDPPYNTGNKDFVYNDDYVDKEDGYRHSKWLSFMRKRLELARELLKPSGAIFISIDDNEQAHLRILCDRVFGETNFVANVIWQKKYTQSNDAKYFSTTHDFILCYANDIRQFNINLLTRTEDQISRYSNPDNDSRGPWASQPIQVKTPSKAGIYEIVTPVGKKFNPPRGRSWQFSKGRYTELVDDNRIWFGENGQNVPRIKKFLSEVKEGVIPKTVWLYNEVGSNDDAKRLLKEIVPERSFDSPKPVSLIAHIINLTCDKNATIMDFMAGSGTTGHAVMSLNSQDSGLRRFILCANNRDGNGDHRIMSEICYPRLERVIKGYKNTKGEKVAGLGGNLSYYQTDLVNIEKIHKIPDEAKIRVTYQAGEMIAVREDTLNEVEKNEWWQIFEGKGRMTAIYFKEDKSKLGELIEKLEKKNIFVALYIFSWGKNEYKGEYSSVNIRVEDIPEPILEVYKEINRL